MQENAAPTAVEHGITIEAQPWHAVGVMFVAMCLCGWTTPPSNQRELAVVRGERHMGVEHARATGPITCTPWCQYGDGHPASMFVVDQRCYSPDLRIDLTLHEPVDESFHVEGYGYVPGPDHLEVNATQAGHEPQPHIEIRRDSDEQPCVTWKFTPSEARQLVESVQLLLGQISAGNNR